MKSPYNPMSEQPVSLSYKVIRTLFRAALRLTMDLDVKGFEQTPMEGPLLIAANHTALWEAPIVFAFIPRVPISVFAKQEWQGTPIGKLMDVLDAIYVTRGEIDRTALKETLKRLKQGTAFGIAPEGTRSKTGKLMEAKEGTAYLALQSDAWVMPVAVWGHENAPAQWKRLRRPKVFVRVGEPFKLTSDPALSRQENLAAGTRRIMHGLARLLPDSYRGFYADAVRET